jgi:hypothetical protein
MRKFIVSSSRRRLYGCSPLCRPQMPLLLVLYYLIWFPSSAETQNVFFPQLTWFSSSTTHLVGVSLYGIFFLAIFLPPLALHVRTISTLSFPLSLYLFRTTHFSSCFVISDSVHSLQFLNSSQIKFLIKMTYLCHQNCIWFCIPLSGTWTLLEICISFLFILRTSLMMVTLIFWNHCRICVLQWNL